MAKQFTPPVLVNQEEGISSSTGLIGVVHNSMVRRETDQEGTVTLEETVPIPPPMIMADVFRLTAGGGSLGDNGVWVHQKTWPKSCDGMLFYVEDGEIEWLTSVDKFFAWLKRIASPGVVHWKKGESMTSQSEFFHMVHGFVEHFVSLEVAPHYPPMEGHHYIEHMEPKRTGKLDEFVDLFSVETPLDRELLKLATITPGWGGPPGQRPGFVLNGPRGSGKSKYVEALGLLYGGLMSFGLKDRPEEIEKRILSPHAANKRIVLLDNVKGKADSAKFESMITSREISGRALYRGEGTRTNTLGWYMTTNDYNASKDLAQRTVTISLVPPKEYEAGNWDRRMFRMVEEDRVELLQDVLWELKHEKGPLTAGGVSRWGMWEEGVLATSDRYEELRALILDRREVADVDEDVLEGFFELAIQNITDAALWIGGDHECVRVPSEVVAWWWLCTGDGWKGNPSVTRLIMGLKTRCKERTDVVFGKKGNKGRYVTFLRKPEADLKKYDWYSEDRERGMFGSKWWKRIHGLGSGE